MGVLEQVIKMRKQNMPNEQIVSQLREEGFSPMEIEDALNQSQIKNAVSRDSEETEYPNAGVPPAPSSNEGTYTPQTEEMPEETYNPPSDYYYSQEPQTEAYPQEAAYSAGGYDADTMVEIAEQVFSEEIKKIQKKFEELNEFKALYKTKVDNAIERLNRIESMIDKLQAAILEKIGSYGNNLETIKKEMSMMQDSFGKMVPSLAKKYSSEKTATKTQTAKHKKKSKKK